MITKVKLSLCEDNDHVISYPVATVEAASESGNPVMTTHLA